MIASGSFRRTHPGVKRGPRIPLGTGPGRLRALGGLGERALRKGMRFSAAFRSGCGREDTENLLLALGCSVTFSRCGQKGSLPWTSLAMPPYEEEESVGSRGHTLESTPQTSLRYLRCQNSLFEWLQYLLLGYMSALGSHK